MNKKEVREAFRQAVFERDGHKCRKCRRQNCSLDAHHITDRREMPNGGYVVQNGISMCDTCHLLAELWHASEHQEFVAGYHPDELYSLIGSSWEAAWGASEALSESSST